MKKLSWMLVLLIAAAFMLGACGGANPAPSGGAKPAPTEAVQSAEPTELPAAKPSSSSSNANGNENESKPVELKDVTSGLDALNSYKSTFTMGFDGKDNGQPKTGSFKSIEEFVKSPPAKRTTFSGFGATSGTPEANAGDNMIQTIEVGGKQYSVFGKTCVSSDSAEAPKSTPSFQPSSIIGDIRGAQLVGTENVNGVPTAHYKADVSPYAALGYVNANSDVWIAQPGDYVVKYVFEATGKDTFFGSSNSEGTLKWTYELSDINQPIDISAPKDCSGAAEDIPIMADAKDKSTFGGMSSYSSPSKFEDVTAFYEKEMAKNGWTENTQGGLSAEGMAQKTFTKEGRTVQVIITTDQSSGGTSVIIQEEKK